MHSGPGGKGYPKINQSISKKKKTNAKNNNQTKRSFSDKTIMQLRSDFRKHWRAQRLGVYRGSMNKEVINMLYTNGTKKKQNTENEQTSIQTLTF